MRLARLLVVATTCVFSVSCGDDPFTPDGPYVAPVYRASLQSLDASFHSVCGTSSNDLYVVSDVILHFDGSRWNPVEPPAAMLRMPRLAVQLASGELLVTDAYNAFVRRNGAWSSAGTIPEFANDLWGSAPDDLYSQGWENIFHYDGVAWSALDIPRGNELRDISGNAAGHVVMCGYFGRIDRFDGTQWTQTWIDSTLDFQSVAVTPSGRVFVADWETIYEIVGATATPILRNYVERAMLKADGETLYAAGGGGSACDDYRVAQYDGENWHHVAAMDHYIDDYWAGNGEVFTVGSNQIWRGDAAGGERISPYPSRGTMQDAVAIGDAIYTIGAGAYHYQNDVWTNLNKEYITRSTAWTIHGQRPNDIYAAGSGMILHYDGEQWEWVNGALNRSLSSIWVEQTGNVVAVGDGVVEFDGSTWTATDVAGNAYWFADVVGIGDKIIAVGDRGLIAMRQDGRWYVLPPPTNAHLVAVWAYDETHVYAASRNANEMCFFDGRSWSPLMIDGPALETMTSVWGTSPSNLFVLDYSGTLAHFDGNAWSAEQRIFSEGMVCVTGAGGDVMTLGRSGSVIYRR